MSLHACTRCEGLIPAKSSRCPHCEWKPTKAWRTLALAAAALGLGASCGTPSAAYGVPCTGATTDPLFCQPCTNSLPDGGKVANEPSQKDRCKTDGGM